MAVGLTYVAFASMDTITINGNKVSKADFRGYVAKCRDYIASGYECTVMSSGVLVGSGFTGMDTPWNRQAFQQHLTQMEARNEALLNGQWSISSSNQNETSQANSQQNTQQDFVPISNSTAIAKTRIQFIKASVTSSGYVWISISSDSVIGMKADNGAGVENPNFQLNRGDIGVFHIQNQDSQTHSAHNFNIDEFDVHTRNLNTLDFEGQTVSFIADKAGTFHYYCSLHPEMRGDIIVQPSLPVLMPNEPKFTVPANNHYIKASYTSSGYVWISTSSNSVMGMSGSNGSGVENPNYLFKRRELEVFHVTNEDVQTHSQHNFNIDAFGVHSRDLNTIGYAGEALAFVANETGTYRYYCSIHPEMKGDIMIQ